MKKSISFLSLGLVIVSWSGCAGMKVVRPNEENKNAGTKALDLSGGTPKFVSTHTCNLESTGNKFSAVGKTEEDARKEVLAKCRDHAMLSFCSADKITCVKN
jgi:hypothetical protein